MKIFLPLLSMIISLSSFVVGDSAYVISSRAYLYNEASFSSQKVAENGQELVLNHGQELVILDQENDFVLVSLTIDENEYSGYIYKYYITSSSSQTVYPVFNGSVRREATIYDMDYNPKYTIKSGQSVYIYNGYDDDDEYTAVQVVLEDGSLYNGYVRTEDLQPQGISPLLIVGISIISACITVILSLVFIKKSKKIKNN